jgi:hypothetical protein
VDEWDALGPGMKIDRRSTDWGLVSLGIGGFFLIMAPIQLIFNDFYWCFGIHRADRQEIELGRVIAPVVGGTFVALQGFSVYAGFRGLSLARESNHPTALPLGGILVSGLDIILWIGLTANLLAILGVFA